MKNYHHKCVADYQDDSCSSRRKHHHHDDCKVARCQPEPCRRPCHEHDHCEDDCRPQPFPPCGPCGPCSPFPNIVAHLCFPKTDATSGALLPGAQFTLCRAVSSDRFGFVDFGMLSPGTYTLQETAAPDGYLLDSTVYSVVVGSDGSVSVDGAPLSSFSISNTSASPLPSPQPIVLSDLTNAATAVVSGTGVPGATITITWPGAVISTALVDALGNWTITRPVGVNPQIGDVISVSQTVPGMAASLPLVYTVAA